MRITTGSRADSARKVPPTAHAALPAALLVLVGVLFLGACGGEEKDAVNKGAATATAPAGEPIVIRATLIVAAEEGSEDCDRHGS